MPAVRQGAAGRWSRRASAASPDYQAGIESTPNSWEANTVAAHESYKAGVMKAAQEGRQMAGVKKSGQAWWKDRALKVGPGRFAEGVTTSEATYQEGVAPYLEVIANTSLPPRGPKGDPRNYARVQAMGDALRKKKMGASK